MASPLPSFERLPCPTVQLLHELPDGTSHIDWMIARDRDGIEPLVSFRLAHTLDELSPGERMDAERIADHRPAYLDYEGPLSGDRGTVTRTHRGVLTEVARSPDGIDMLMRIRWLWPGHQFDPIQFLKLRPPNADRCSIWCVRLYESPAAVAAGHAHVKEKP